MKKVCLILLMGCLATGVSMSLSWALNDGTAGVMSLVGDSSNTDTSGGSFSLRGFSSAADAMRSWGENNSGGESQEGNGGSFVEFLMHNNSETSENGVGLLWGFFNPNNSGLTQTGQWSGYLDALEGANWATNGGVGANVTVN